MACLLTGVNAVGFAYAGSRVAAPALAADVSSSETSPRATQRLRAAAAEGEAAGHEALFTWINFIILIAVLVYVLRKPIAAFFAGRSHEIGEGLEAGRKALAEAEARLSGVEVKLAHLGEELAEFKASALREMESERARLKEATEREAARIIEGARQEIEAAARAAEISLRAYTADETVRQAEESIRQRLDAASRERLVSRFVAGLAETRAVREN